MQVDLVGRIKNTHSPYAKQLLPLYEAIINSIYAINENKVQNGKIDIYIERDNEQQELAFEGQDSRPIKNFIIIDNGIGFNDENYNSFQISDSTRNAQRGAKGIGRFHWLKAFEKVHIESIFFDGTKYYKRTFDFILSNEGIENHTCVGIDRADRETQVRLLNFKDKYKESCPRRTKIIAARIIEHCLIYFLSEQCPQIRIIDDKEETISLNSEFVEYIKKKATKESFTIKSQEFQITHLRIYSSEDNKHRIHYLAHDREVKHENISNILPDLSKKIVDEDGNAFVYLAYVSGKYLDERVNSERTDFNLTDEDEVIFPDDITKNELKKEIITKIKNYLKLYLESIQKDKIKTITDFVQKKAPQYKPVLKYGVEYLEEIPLSANDDESLDIELHKITSRIEVKIKEKGREILKKDVSQIKDLDEYKQDYNKFIEQINEFGKAKLAQYIIHRRLILDLLNNNLKHDSDKKYSPEEAIHEIIFPLKHSSDEVNYERQNLWVIDERLAYHKYLASDKPLKQVNEIKVDSSERPDLMILNPTFDAPHAFVDSTPPYSSIVIIEFKRPGRTSYTEKDNPITQMYGYIRKIKDANINDKDGRPFSAVQNTPFYGYIICDLTTQIKEFAQNASLNTTPDNMGYFGYNPNLAAYIEIISFDKLISDATKRNKILFDKLNLPID